MKTKTLILCAAALLVWLTSTSTALAGGPIRIGINSQQYGPSRARVRAHLDASAARPGEAGAPSWFWLDPAPTRQSLSITLAGETVSVIADPTVEWRFGDGASLAGGPGVPYEASTSAAGAITHAYQTRCLPGDQGHDPY